MSFPSQERQTKSSYDTLFIYFYIFALLPPCARHFIKKRMAINLLHFRLSFARTKANKNCFKKLSLRHIGNLPLSFVRISSPRLILCIEEGFSVTDVINGEITVDAQSFETLIFKEFLAIF